MNRWRAALLALGALTSIAGGRAAEAQQVAKQITQKTFETFDANGVSLLAPTQSQVATDFGSVRIKEPAIGIGDPKFGGLYYQRTRTAQAAYPNNQGSNNYEVQLRDHNLFGTASLTGVSGVEDPVPKHTFSLDGQSETFVGVLTTPTTWAYAATEHTGSSLNCLPPNFCSTYTRSDGAVLTYQSLGLSQDPQGRITSLTKPDGEVITWNYYTIPSGTWAGIWRLQSVTNNLGYQIHFQYEQDATPTTADQAWRFLRPKKVTAINNTLNPCAPTAFTCDANFGGEWPYLVYDYEGTTVQTVTDRLGNVHRFYYDSNIQTTTPGNVKLLAYRSPAASADDISIQYNPLRVTNASGLWTYTFTPAVTTSPTTGTGGVTQVSGPNGYAQTIQYSYVPESLYYPTPTPVPLTVTTNGRTTAYEHELVPSPYLPGSALVATRLKKVTGQDGDFDEYEYDARRNVTHLRSVPKPGSGLAEIHTYASYPESGAINCSNAKTCNKPVWTIVAGPASATPSSLPKTDYTYDTTHGGMLTETKPAPGSGPYAAIRPQVRYTYSTNGTAIYRLTAASSCKTTASCAGTVDETKVETTYNAKRLPSSVVTRAGNNTTAGTSTYSTVAMTYTLQGDVESVDGPLSGAVDKTWTFYDGMRRPRVTVGPDPDGAGVLVYRTTRTTYDSDSNPTAVEQGSVTAPANCSAANSFCSTTMTLLAKATTEYDSFGRKARENAINVTSGLAEAVAQYSYDSAGRVECVAKRMNAAVYGSLPSACTQSTTGSFGQDQIVRTTYTVNGDPSVIQSGYGAAIVRNERTMTYLAPGQVSTVKDANNNLTTYTYDGFNRLQQTRYPVATTGGNASSATDYEELLYDGSGRVASERRRDGLTILNTYDNLDRLTFIDRPNPELDITNGYDNYSNLVSASQTGASVTWTYDALGRVLTEVQPNGTVSYTYDTAGRRTQLTYPGASFFTNYQYYDDGRIKLIGLNGATTGANVLATYYDDQLGRRASVCRGTGTAVSCSSVARTAYGYDAISRLTSLNQDLTTGTAANDISWTLSYSPASQLVSRAASASTYEWPATATFSDSYAVNGLNQYTTVAGLSLAYDGRGNTTNDTTKSYTYDSSNRLTSASNGATLTYDPSGRLLSVVQGTSTTKFLYDGTRLIAEYNGSNTLLRRYVHGDGIDDPIVWYDSSGTTNKRNLFKDERGSVIAADTGSAVTTIKYDEYGNATATGSTVPRFQYTGQTWISELGLNYYKARFYTPDLGRFMQTDPIGMKDQVNLYAYVGNDPSNRIDPTGKYGTGCDGFMERGGSACFDGDWDGRSDRPGPPGPFTVLPPGTTGRYPDLPTSDHGSADNADWEVLQWFVGGKPTMALLTDGGKAAGRLITYLGKETGESVGQSVLRQASNAAFKAAKNADSYVVGTKHLAGSGGGWAKFATGTNPNALLREALSSPGAKFLPNDATSFKLVTDLGRSIGTKGETGVRVIVDFDGTVVTWFPVRP